MPFEINPGPCEISETAAPILPISPGLHLPFNSRFHGGVQPATRAAVFLDRDGVLVRDVHYLRKSSQIELLPCAASLRALQETFYLVVATNQSGVARGFFTEEDLLTIHSELVLLLAAQGATIDAFYYCPHLESGAVDRYKVGCDCRKPKPGMLLRATAERGIDIRRSYMIGDSVRDMKAGKAGGLAKNILLAGAPDVDGEYTCAKDLAQAVQIILVGAA